MKPNSVSLIITTYNWPEALNLVLASVRGQSHPPNEVIIADDGSKKSTQDLIRYQQKTFPIPLIHSWQQDNGFRLARSRNKAIARSTSDYIIMIDGDMILHPHFVRDHCKAAKGGQFIQGRRTLLTKALSQIAFNTQLTHFSSFHRGIKNKINSLRIPWLSSPISHCFSKQSCHSVRGCNMSMWKDDLFLVNGFNEEFVGWGREDSEFVLRLLNNGIKRYDLRLAGVAYHLYHPEQARDQLKENDRLLDEAIASRPMRCKRGLLDQL